MQGARAPVPGREHRRGVVAEQPDRVGTLDPWCQLDRGVGGQLHRVWSAVDEEGVDLGQS